MHVMTKIYHNSYYRISCITLILYKFICIYKCTPSLNAHLCLVPRGCRVDCNTFQVLTAIKYDGFTFLDDDPKLFKGWTMLDHRQVYRLVSSSVGSFIIPITWIGQLNILNSYRMKGSGVDNPWGTERYLKVCKFGRIRYRNSSWTWEDEMTSSCNFLNQVMNVKFTSWPQFLMCNLVMVSWCPERVGLMCLY